MCGIALLVSGIRLNLSSLPVDSISRKLPEFFGPQDFPFSLDDLKSALRRRGPDSLGAKKLLLSSTAGKDSVIVSFVVDDEEAQFGGKQHTNDIATQTCFSELLFVGATLQLRGLTPISQPLVDSFGNILVYNGEIFGGIQVGRDINDAEILMQYLGKVCSCHSHRQGQTCNLDEEERSCIPDVLSSIKGPWALIYWQSCSNTLWFGRDAFGRRSLLVHWPTMEDNRFLLSSVSASSPSIKSCDLESDNGNGGIKFWEELSCGIYSMSVNATTFPGHIGGEVKKHEWTNGLLRELIEWKRISVVPKPEDIDSSRSKSLKDRNEPGVKSPDPVSESARDVLMALQESIMRRTSLYTIFQGVSCDSNIMEPVPVAVLFSGGLDSMILAALLDRCLDPKYEIDLLNVSFDGELAPDRISANAGVKELKRVAPFRRWRLVYINAELSKLTTEMKLVLSIIDPANTYMDLNIGTALWLAARGEGWVHKTDSGDNEYVKYKSGGRILLVGSGADEQCAGYGRHRTKYRNDSWLGLHEEMRLDMQRIWKRNLGRDDRCIADNGKEARFPFLDEDVIRTLLKIPLWEVADLEQPSGRGDKKILREVAHLLGLHEAAVLPKRAIQFGSRIARESNRKNFGSNRAANQASAGSAVIHMPCPQSHT